MITILFLCLFLSQTSILTLGYTGVDAILQHLLQGVVVSADRCGVQHLHKVGHLALGQVVGDGVVPGVGHTLPVDAEHAGGQSIQLARASLDVILCVVLSPTKCTCEATSHIWANLLEIMYTVIDMGFVVDRLVWSFKCDPLNIQHLLASYFFNLQAPICFK